ncbi:rab effector MyRIP isoform X2 [Polypterus senegalus]|uniref:rab effector MyRIP isoform X2 n=1 Tax=Polypterus senegalus TaxID=55291 RepID=UPI001964677E|nr:rab effector MyRIP isoform X2 [Polypterus senegalus]
MMGRKLDLSGLTGDEADHVLQVVQRDINLRKKEKERLSEMKQALEEEGSKCSILSKQTKFNERCCIRCCTPFTFLINTKRQCLDCKFNVCKSCSSYSKKEKAWICTVCQKSRLLRTQSLEWYYNNVKSRFKRFGSAKVLKTLYKKYLSERGILSDVTENSVYEGSIDGSICGSDSTFYKQSEGHSMAETLTVALRVAEEAVEEAISKAEAYSDSLEKQNEAYYLRENKEELIEELATTIVQKIIKRRKCPEMQSEYELAIPQSESSKMTSPCVSEHSTLTSQASCKGSYTLWRSQSAFSLASDERLERQLDSNWRSAVVDTQWRRQEGFPNLKKESRPSSMPSWRSMDMLDNSSSSSVLQSPDGNWIALQSTILSRPCLLTKPKSQLYAALEKETDIISAYDEMGTDTDDEYDWNYSLTEQKRSPRRLSEESCYTDSQHDPEWTYTKHWPVTSPSSGRFTNTETVGSDSETSSLHSLRNHSTYLHKEPILKRKSPCLAESMDINFNPQVRNLGTADSSETEEFQSDSVRKARCRRKTKSSSRLHSCRNGSSLKIQRVQPSASFQHFSDGSLGSDHFDEERPMQSDTDAIELELKSKLSRIAAKISDKDSSSEDETEWNVLTSPVKVPEESSSCEDADRKVYEDDFKKYSAASLCSITAEVLKVINATEDLIEEVDGNSEFSTDLQKSRLIPEGTDTGKLDEHLTKLEENVYLTASTVYGLEGHLGELEECARSINTITTENELAHLEDQVATAAAKVHQAEIQLSDIEQRISALKIAGLNVTPCMRFTKLKEQRLSRQTIDTSRNQRRKLPAIPVQESKICHDRVSPVTFNRNPIYHSSLERRSCNEDKSIPKDNSTPKFDVSTSLMY